MARKRKTELHRLAELRDRAGWSQEELAGRAKLSTAQVSRYESGATSPFAGGFHRIADALGMPSPADLISARGGQARLLGYVGAGEIVFGADDDGEPMPAPPGMDHAIAIRVQGTSMMPAYRPGDLIFAEDVALAPDTIVNRDCVVETNDGRRLVKKVLSGGLPGTYGLMSYETQEVEPNVRLRSAAPVRWVQRA